MANLTGKKISSTYTGLIKTETNSSVQGTTLLTDGSGQSLQITVNTDGTLTAQTITANNLNISNWDEAYSWGDHSLAGYATSVEVAAAVNDVINAAPAALDTLDELAAALNDDANFATTMTNLISGVSDRVTALENAGFITTDTNTQLSDSDIAAMGYIKTDTNTQLTDAEIAAMGYIKVDTNTQRTDAEIDARIALNPQGFITSYVDTNTQLTDAEIAAMGYVKTDTQLTDAEIAALGYIKTDTNTQRTDAEIDARIALNPQGFITSYVDTNTQLSDADIAAMGYIKTDTNTQLTDSEVNTIVSALGYIKTDTNTQRTDAEIQAIIDNNTNGFVTTDTNTQLSDADIAAFGYVKTDTQLTDAEVNTIVSALGYIKTDTNTQRTDAEIDARIALNPEGFLTSETDSQTLTFTSATGDLTISNGNTVNIPDNNTQRTDAEINSLIDANTNGYITDYTVTEADVTAHESALSITQSQISDLSHFSGSYNDLTDKPAGIVARSDEEIQDVVGSAISGSGATSVVYNDAAGTIVVSSTDTNTQLTDAEIAAFGYIKTDTNTQLTDAEIAAMGYIKVDTNTQLTDAEIAAFGYVKTDTQLTDSDIAAFGYIKTDTNTQRTDAEIQAIIDANSAGFITTFTDTNTQLSDEDIAALGYIKTDTNTQLSDADIAALGYIKTDTNTQRTDSEINALITTGITGLATETYVDNAVAGLVDTAPTTLDTLNELANALGDDPNFATTVSTNIGSVSDRVTTLENAGYITTDTNTQRTDAEIQAIIDNNSAGFVTTDTNTQLSDQDIADLGYIKTDTNTQRTDAEIQSIIDANSAGFVTTDTNTQRTDAEIQSIIDTNTAGFVTTDTNTQRTDAEIDARIALNPEGFVTTDTNTQRTDAEIQGIIDANSAGFITTDTNTQRTDEEIQDVVGGLISGDGATSVTYNDAAGTIVISSTDTNTNTQRTDEEIRDVIGSAISGSGATTVTVDDAANTIIVSSTDTNTQRTDTEINDLIAAAGITPRTDAEIDARIALNPEGFVTTDTNTQRTDAEIDARIALNPEGFITTDTNTQRTNEEIQDIVGSMLSGSGATSVSYNDSAGTISISSTDTNTDTNTQRSNEEIQDIVGAMLSGSGATSVDYNDGDGSIVITSTDTNTDTNTQRTNAEIQAIIDANSAGFVTSSGNTIIGTDSDINTSGNTVIDNIFVTDGVITSMGTRSLYISDLDGAGLGNDNDFTGQNTFDDDSTFNSEATFNSNLVVAGDFNSLYVGGKTNSSQDGMRMSIDSSGNGYFDHRGAGNLNFRVDSSTGATTRMTIADTGEVGVGELTPGTRLHVTKAANSHSWSHHGNTIATFENSAAAYVNVTSGSSHTGELWFSDSDLMGRGRVRYDHVNDRMEIWTASSTKFTLFSDGTLTISGSLNENSDARLKENVKTIDGALDKVTRLRGVEYNMIADEDKSTKLGFIAQEVEEVVPELVSDKGEHKAVSYTNTIALLVEAMKEQQKQIDDLQSQIDAMRA